MSAIKEVDVFFENLKKKTLSSYKEIDKKGKVIEKEWNFSLGLMEVRVFQGDVFEKAGISYSAVRIKHPKTGIESDVRVFEILAYMKNPKVPTSAISLRYRFDGEDKFMACCDICPSIDIAEENKYFEDRMKELAKKHNMDFQKMRERQLELFTSKYTGEMRQGGKGIAFDLAGKGFDLFKECGEVFLDATTAIIKRRKDESFTEKDKDKQLHDWGKWVEFNLIEDKGFILGIQVGIPYEAMNFQTLPPVARFYP